MTDGPRVLVLDIETAPSLAYVWRLFKENISLPQLRESGQVFAFAAKWHGEKRIEFQSDFDFTTGEMTGHAAMIQRAWELMDEADLIVHYNGTSFDVPHLNREFLMAGLTPPSPHKNVDLLQTARKRFRFTSNKLDHVAQELGVGGKVQHTGFDLWRRCLNGERAAWVTMRRYNRNDVVITDQVYDKFLPWIQSHPHIGLFSVDPSVNKCGRCGGKVIRKGYAYTAVGVFQRYLCKGQCGSWSRGKHRVDGVDVRPIV